MLSHLLKQELEEFPVLKKMVSSKQSLKILFQS